MVSVTCILRYLVPAISYAELLVMFPFPRTYLTFKSHTTLARERSAAQVRQNSFTLLFVSKSPTPF